MSGMQVSFNFSLPGVPCYTLIFLPRVILPYFGPTSFDLKLNIFVSKFIFVLNMS